jgi:hypothetical protein
VYCICSNCSFDDILQKQAEGPLPRDEMIECYTSCNQGCGSCIDALVSEAEMLELFPASGWVVLA